MNKVIKKWCNRPAVRLSSSVMKIAAFDIEQRVTIKASKGRLIIEPTNKFEFKLETLVAGITRENLHGALISAARWASKRCSGEPKGIGGMVVFLNGDAGS